MDYSHLDRDYDELIDEGENAANAFSQTVDRLEDNLDSAEYNLESYVESLMYVHDTAAPYMELFRDWQDGQPRAQDDDEVVQKAQNSDKILESVMKYEQAVTKYIPIAEELERKNIPHPGPQHLLNYDFDLDRFKSEINLLQASLEG